MTPGDKTDAELVADTLAGNRNAFAEIVRRYQTLVCSLAYSATGDLTRSEDLAQETFCAVWRRLAELREPASLRAWVCGIARNRIQEAIRSHYHEPTYKAQSMDVMDATPAAEDQPSDHAARRDEAAIVWSALEQIPETFREPLILFHRENQSVAQVAALLDLSEDAVKQRLVRGRKLLKAEVEGMIEGALRRTAPGVAFTEHVMLALPVSLATGAKAATGTMLAKGLAGGGMGGFLLEVVTSPFTAAGVLLFENQRMLGQEAAAALNEREVMATHRQTVMRLLVVSAVVLTLWSQWFKKQSQPAWYSLLIPVLTCVVLFLVVGARIAYTRFRLAQLWTERGASPVQHSWEYQSALRLLGCPLIHVRLGFNPLWPDAIQPVRAWIAIGQIAYGRLFAGGYVAIAPVSVGWLTLGVVSVGTGALAPVALGGLLAAGGYAVGGVAIGWKSSGAFTFGLNAARGFAAFAGNLASCPPDNARCIAYAPHANDAVAREFFATDAFFTSTGALGHGDHRLLVILLLTVLPFVLWEIIWELMKGRSRPAQTE